MRVSISRFSRSPEVLVGGLSFLIAVAGSVLPAAAAIKGGNVALPLAHSGRQILEPSENSRLENWPQPSNASATLSDSPVGPQSIFVVNDNGDAADNGIGNGICDTSAASGDQCTLRAAIQEANAVAGDDIVTFGASLNNGTITLLTALPDLSSDMTIAGPAASSLTVRRSAAPGTPRFRIFTTAGSAITVNISGLTISNGHTADGTVGVNGDYGDFGGGVFNNGGVTLTLMSVTISGNATGDGANLGSDSAFGGYGGGIYNLGGLTLSNSIVSGNRTGNGNGTSGKGGQGGGIFYATTITITSSTIDNNVTGNGLLGTGSGGGIAGYGNLIVTNSTISSNRTGTSPSGSGGGIYSTGTLSASNTTISGNQASSNGGGTFTLNNASLINVTVANNRGGNSGGGGLFHDSGTLSLMNTVVAGNFLGSTTNPDDIFGAVNPASSFNLIGTGGSGGLTNGVNNNQVGVADPRLGPLANNGGSTLTHALLNGSLAIDAGNSALTTDQRGQPRPVDDQTVTNAAGSNASDIGAYEAHTFQVNSTADSTDGPCTVVGTGNGCTLREAITAANSEVGAELITFAPDLSSGGPATITLLTALPVLDTDSIISGPGATLLTVQRSTAVGTPSFIIFFVFQDRNVSISGLTISNGDYSGVFNLRGSLTISNCIIDSNRHGVANRGSLIINNSVVSNSTEVGVENEASLGDTLTATINHSTILGNLFGGVTNMGAFAGSLARLTVENSTISGNNFGDGSVGGILTSGVQTGTAITAINNSTISGNRANLGPGFAGGVAALGWDSGSNAVVIINNSTITAKDAPSRNRGAAGMVADTRNGGTATITLHNTIVAGNSRLGGSIASDIVGTVDMASSFNLIGTGGSGGLSNGTNSNQVGVIDTRLGTLANYGGPTLTHALLAGSPAIDAGGNGKLPPDTFDLDGDGNTSEAIPFDQRGAGFARIVDGPDVDTTDTVDIGAFESQVSVPDIANQTINEDGSLLFPFNVGGGASITNVTATSSNTTLVPNNPANISISGSGSSRTLLINPVANASGTSTITVTVNGNNSQSMTDTFLLTVNPINDAPSFIKGPDQTVNENGGAQTVNNWATNISAGPANESLQALTFIVANNSNPALFAVAPTISSTGTLTYTPATGVSGMATVTIALMDSGGIANGGSDTSTTQSFNINVLEGGTLALSAATYRVTEGVGNIAISITRSGGSAGAATVLFATSNGTATAADYTSVSQTITFNDGEVGKTVNVAITDDLFKEPDETVNLTLSNAGGSGQLGAQTTAVLTIVDDDPVGGYVRFSSATLNTTESSGSTAVTVERVGDTTQAVTVDYATSDDGGSTTVVSCSTVNGVASSRCDFTTALGTLRFAAGESSKTFNVLISQDNYVEGPEALTLTLSNLTGGALFATPSTAILTITDDASEPAINPVDNADAFVRQHYHDFLNREPDAAGIGFWSDQITSCGTDAVCIELRRINVSAAFFLSIEFQQTGYLVYRMYKAGYNNLAGTPVPVRLNEFLPDTQQIGLGVVVGQTGWEQVLENNTQAFAGDFVARSRFTTAYPTTQTPAEFVDALFANAGVTPSPTDRDAGINEFGSGATDTTNTAARARALRRVAENSTLAQQETNRAFVLMQYFGYLRRNPNDAPEPGLNFDGYNFWLGKLNQFNGNFVNAEMVKAFILSGEYRQRFGP